MPDSKVHGKKVGDQFVFDYGDEKITVHTSVAASLEEARPIADQNYESLKAEPEESNQEKGDEE